MCGEVLIAKLRERQPFTHLARSQGCEVKERGGEGAGQIELHRTSVSRRFLATYLCQQKGFDEVYLPGELTSDLLIRILVWIKGRKVHMPSLSLKSLKI